MGGEYKTDNHVSGYAKDKLLAWKHRTCRHRAPRVGVAARANSSRIYETLVRHTYDWSKVTDKKLLEHAKFPLVTKDQLTDTLARLAAATPS